MRRVWPLLLLALTAGAAELTLLEHDPLVRPGSLLHLGLGRDAGPAAPGPRMLSVVVTHAGQAVATTRIPLQSAHQLDHGVHCWLPIPAELRATSLRCVLRLDGGTGDPAELTLELASWGGQMQRLAALSARIVHQSIMAPQVRLWLEQAQLGASAEPDLATAGLVMDRLDRIDAWLAGGPSTPASPGSSQELALRCPIDGSVQPLRLTRPSGTLRGVVSCLIGANDPPRKDRWAPLPAPWYQRADALGLAVLEWYPAGDIGWRGIAVERVRQLLAPTLAEHALEALPQALLGVGGGAHGALQLAAEQPERWAALAVIDPAAPAASGNPALPPELAAWFDLRRSIQNRAGSLRGLPIRHSGRLPASWQAVIADGHGIEDSLSPEELWQWLGVATGMPPARPSSREWRLLGPGRYGPVEVQALETWGAPAQLRLERREDGFRLSGSNIAALRWVGPGDPASTDDSLPSLGSAVPRGIDKHLGRATGPVGSYASGPFAVVVGRSGNLAANERNRRLGQAFLQDWVAHAQGAPPWCFDDEYSPERFAGRHLVCIGAPASNRVVAALDRQVPLPLRWDVRGVHLDDRSYRDGSELAVAVCRPRPDDPSRLLVILDGAIGWTRSGDLAPLTDWPDLAVVPQPGYHDLGPEPEPVWRLFDNGWE